MRPFITVLALLICAAGGLTGCENCGPSGEPNLTVQFTRSNGFSPDTTVFARVYSLNGNLNQTNVALRNGQLTLPLALTADSTSYAFARPSRTDTLTVFYRRTFSYQSDRCGYVLDLAAARGKSVVKTSFRNASGGFTGRNGGAIVPASGPQNTGILVNATL